METPRREGVYVASSIHIYFFRPCTTPDRVVWGVALYKGLTSPRPAVSMSALSSVQQELAQTYGVEGSLMQLHWESDHAVLTPAVSYPPAGFDIQSNVCYVSLNRYQLGTKIKIKVSQSATLG